MTKHHQETFLTKFTKIDYNSILKKSGLGLLFTISSTILGVVNISLLINWIGQDIYGNWVTLYSICSWINYFDGGIGNSIRNELSKSLLKDNTILSRKIISTGYISLFGLIILFFGITLIIQSFINWNKILSDNSINYNTVAIFVFGFFLLQLCFKIISKVLFSFKKSELSFLIPLINNLFIFLSILTLKYIRVDSEFWCIAIIFSIIPILTLLAFTFYFFGFKKKDFRPSVYYFDLKLVNSLVSKGISFFFIQISGGILQAVMPFFITYYFQSKITAEYQVALKLYLFFIVIQNIVLQTNWYNITEAKFKNEKSKLKNLLTKNIILTVFLSLFLCLVFYYSNTIYSLWINKDFLVNKDLNLYALLFVLSMLISKVFSNFLNAINDTKLQSYYSIILLISCVPLIALTNRIYPNSLDALLIAPIILTMTHIIFSLSQIKKHI